MERGRQLEFGNAANKLKSSFKNRLWVRSWGALLPWSLLGESGGARTFYDFRGFAFTWGKDTGAMTTP